MRDGNLDATLVERLDALVPMPSVAGASWEDALERAASQPEPRPSRRRRRLVVALAAAFAALAALAATPLGSAVAGGLADFSSWLAGDPGEPASPAEQRAFEEGERRSWGILTETPDLRRLIRVERGGAMLTLYSYRTESALCLRLVVDGVADPPANACAALDALREPQPAVVAAALDHVVGRRSLARDEVGYASPRFAVTFGIAAAEVEGVDVVTEDGSEPARLVSNAFLSVRESPALGVRTNELIAVRASGDTDLIAPADSPFRAVGTAGPPGVAPGPRTVQRNVTGGSIAWMERDGAPSVERVIAPEAGKRYRFVVRPGRESVCSYLYLGDAEEGSGGCGLLDRFFGDKPFTVGGYVESSFESYVVLEGFASDDVARLDLFVATGERRAVPLRDNVYLTSVERAVYPIRLVAYDDAGRVVGIEHDEREPLAGLGGPTRYPSSLVYAVRAADGTRVTLEVGAASDGGRCFTVDADRDPKAVMCAKPRADGTLVLYPARDAGHPFLFGPVPEGADRVRVRFRDGTIRSFAPVESFVIAPLPVGSEPESAAALGPDGARLATQTFGR